MLISGVPGATHPRQSATAPPANPLKLRLRALVRHGRVDAVWPVGASRATAVQPSKCRLANARPEPDFRYLSKRRAGGSSLNSTTTCACHARRRAVWGQRPMLWSTVVTYVRGQANVEVWFGIGVFQDVDESLVSSHARRSARNCLCARPISLLIRGSRRRTMAVLATGWAKSSERGYLLRGP